MQKKRSSLPRTRPRVRNVCVYCGSGSGQNPAYAEAARTLGKSLAEHDIGLVYGGGGLGLMGEVARATLAAGGRVTGVIPKFLTQREHMLEEADDLIVTQSMHERKQIMFDRSDAFVALPGGIGTLEELVEQLTWTQLGRHKKPVVVVDIAKFWTPFLTLLGHMKSEQFIRDGLDVRFKVVEKAEQAVPVILASADGKTDIDTEISILTKF